MDISSPGVSLLIEFFFLFCLSFQIIFIFSLECVYDCVSSQRLEASDSSGLELEVV